MTRNEIRIKYKLDFERDISLAKRIIDDFKKEPMIEQLNNECIRLRQELEDIKNRSCENCMYCDYVEEQLIHCIYLELLLPKEIGKCDEWESKQ